MPFAPVRKRYVKNFWGYGNRLIRRKEEMNGRNKYFFSGNSCKRLGAW